MHYNVPHKMLNVNTLKKRQYTHYGSFCFLQFRKYAVPFLLCGREPLLEDETSEMVTTVETQTNKVSPA